MPLSGTRLYCGGYRACLCKVHSRRICPDSSRAPFTSTEDSAFKVAILHYSRTVVALLHALHGTLIAWSVQSSTCAEVAICACAEYKPFRPKNLHTWVP